MNSTDHDFIDGILGCSGNRSSRISKSLREQQKQQHQQQQQQLQQHQDQHHRQMKHNTPSGPCVAPEAIAGDVTRDFRWPAIECVAKHLGVSALNLLVVLPEDRLSLSYCFIFDTYRKKYTDQVSFREFCSPKHMSCEKKEKARMFLQSVLEALPENNMCVEAARLRKGGIEGYPRIEDVKWFAKIANVKVHLFNLESRDSPLPEQRVGSGRRVINIGYLKCPKHAKTRSSMRTFYKNPPHFLLLNSYADFEQDS